MFSKHSSTCTYDMLFSNNSVTAPGQTLFSTLDFLTGFDAREGCVMMSLFVGVSDPDSFEPNRTYYNENLIPEALAVAFGLNSAADVSELVSDVVRHQYTHWPDPELMEAIRDQFASLHSDIAFTEIQLQTVMRHASLSQETEAGTYIYHFDVLPSAHPMPSPAWCVRASHGDEMVYEFFEEDDGLMTFVPGYENWTAEEWERDMAKTVMALWTNFAKTGHPSNETYWPAYTNENPQYLHITREWSPSSVKKYLLAEEFNLWQTIIPKARACKRKRRQS